jgi:hypothetical protein
MVLCGSFFVDELDDLRDQLGRHDAELPIPAQCFGGIVEGVDKGLISIVQAGFDFRDLRFFAGPDEPRRVSISLTKSSTVGFPSRLSRSLV